MVARFYCQRFLQQFASHFTIEQENELCGAAQNLRIVRMLYRLLQPKLLSVSISFGTARKTDRLDIGFRRAGQFRFGMGLDQPEDMLVALFLDLGVL